MSADRDWTAKQQDPTEGKKKIRSEADDSCLQEFPPMRRKSYCPTSWGVELAHNYMYPKNLGLPMHGQYVLLMSTAPSTPRPVVWLDGDDLPKLQTVGDE